MLKLMVKVMIIIMMIRKLRNENMIKMIRIKIMVYGYWSVIKLMVVIVMLMVVIMGLKNMDHDSGDENEDKCGPRNHDDGHVKDV